MASRSLTSSRRRATRGSSRCTSMPRRSSSASTLDLPAWSETSTRRAVADALGRHVLVGARVLQHGRGVDAGLGGEGGGADIGRMAVRRAVQQLVERARHGVSDASPAVVHADLEAVGEVRLQHQRRDQRHEVGVAAALAEAVQRALDLPRRRRARRPANWRRLARCRHGRGCRACRPGCAGATSPTMRLDLVRQRAAIGVAQHDPARARLEGGLGAGAAHRRGWPCSRRRSARSRAAPRGRRRRRRDAVADALEVLLQRAAERDMDVVVPGLGDEADRRPHLASSSAARRGRWRPSGRPAWSCRRR